MVSVGRLGLRGLRWGLCWGVGRAGGGTWRRGKIREGKVVRCGGGHVAWRLGGCVLGRVGIKAVGALGPGGGRKVTVQRGEEAVQTKDGELL